MTNRIVLRYNRIKGKKVCEVSASRWSGAVDMGKSRRLNADVPKGYGMWDDLKLDIGNYWIE